MIVKKSVCTNMLFPKSRTDLAEFEKMAHFLAEQGVELIEFYHDGSGGKSGKIGRILEDVRLEGIYIAVLPAKEQKKNACSSDTQNRAAAVQLFKDCMDEAADNGIETLMINSGSLGANVQDGMIALKESVTDLYEYIAKKNYRMHITLEPGDTWMYAKQLIGPSERAASFAKECEKEGMPLELTMDSAHAIEEGKAFDEAVRITRPWCRHIHFANCFIKDTQDPLYGDQHLGFEYQNTACGFDTIVELWPKICALYPDEEVRVAIEVLCREEDPYQYFLDTWNRLPYVTA